MKKILLTLSLLFVFISCSSKKNYEVIRLGYIGEFDVEIWESLGSELKSKKIVLELIPFSDYSALNRALNSKYIDLNHFQHYAYFIDETNKNDYYLGIVDRTFIASMNIYSRNITNLSQLSLESKIAVPKDHVNFSRALKILESVGLLKLYNNNDVNYNFTTNDIIENSLNLELVAIDANNIYSAISSVDAAIVNYNYNFDFKNENVLYSDDPSKYYSDMYINLIVSRLEDVNNVIYKIIADTYKNRVKKLVESGKLKGIILNY
ncbi:MetQ/NlpA family ABC transporter substrate-binding protein [Brachyspira sp.]|uniref:MetQ/NlpA family ABC transporter substrate-binding protein n=1 Tax=Brachyspira sp. TaxID=1977261 RepID=UPI002602D50E|nr:MetQ/NlpA family ABC transporter substrate-binding protein [Brachyspira sp.]